MITNVIILQVRLRDISMFIACGRNEDGSIRVHDTSDNTVESVTVEQLKLVQAGGHNVIFDESYDYIYRFYNSFSGNYGNLEILRKMPDSPLRGIWNPCVSYIQFVEMIVYLVFNDDKMVLFNVRCSDNRYSMMYRDDIRTYFDASILRDNLHLMRNDVDKMGFYTTAFGIDYCVIFDIDLNYIGTEKCRY